MSILVIQHDPDKGLGLFAQPLADAALELDICFAGHGELELGEHHTRRHRAAGRRQSGRRDAGGRLDARRCCARRSRGASRCSASASAPSCSPRPPARARAPARPSGATARSRCSPPRARTVCSPTCPSASASSRRTTTASSCRRAPSRWPGRPARCRPSASDRNAWGIQFHPEPTLEMLDGWTTALGAVMQANGVDPEATRRLGRRYVPGLERARRGDDAPLRGRRRRLTPIRRRRRAARAARWRRDRRAAGAAA